MPHSGQGKGLDALDKSRIIFVCLSPLSLKDLCRLIDHEGHSYVISDRQLRSVKV